MAVAYPILPEPNLYEFGLWLLHCRRRFTVKGDSMQPALHPGDVVLLNPRAYRHCLPQVSDIVVAWHPQQPGYAIIKRVVDVQPNGDCFVQGDNYHQSTDSRSFGTVPYINLLGQVTCFFYHADRVHSDAVLLER